MKEQRKNSYIQTDVALGYDALQLPSSAEKPAAFIDFRALQILSTKVLADKVTIDEIL
jgi:hypothetical protein